MDIISPRKVGNSDLEVTPLGFGGAVIGSPQVTNEASLETVAGAWESGVRFYDTAPWYGIGRSERRLGMALSELADRTEYRLNTKVGKTLVPEPERDESRNTLSPEGETRTVRDPLNGFRIDFNYRYDRILQQHHDSLQRLGLSSVDSLTIHDIDYGYHSDEQIEGHLQELSREGGAGASALEELRNSGVIKAIGCGCNLETRNANSWLDDRHESLIERIVEIVDLDFLLVAGAYTLLETRALRSILPLCEDRGIGVIIGAPYASGWLAAPNDSSTYMYGPVPAQIKEKSLRMQAICSRHGASLASAALQFPLAHPSVAAVIPGARSAGEAMENSRHLSNTVPGEVWAELKSEGLLDSSAPTPE
jgi:D-threo-aldose 1-dehydrogenase